MIFNQSCYILHMIRHRHSSTAFKWCSIIFLCWMTTQFLGHQHRITHSFSLQNPAWGNSQFNSPNQAQLQSTLGESPEIEHHCSAWDHGALGFGLALGILAFEVLFALFIFKPSLCFKGQFSLFFPSYRSRAPPATY
jgi:hypothetical protein